MSRGGTIFHYNYQCPCGRSYGKKLYLSPPVPSMHDTGLEVKSPRQTVNNLPKSPGDVDCGEKASQHQGESILREQLREKDELIARFRELIRDYEASGLDKDKDKVGQSTVLRGQRSTGESHSSPTQKLLELVQRLQEEKMVLLQKVSEFEIREARQRSLHLPPSNSHSLSTDHRPSPNGYSSALSDTEPQIGSCTTDTEKELEKVKNRMCLMQTEIQRLYQENSRLKNQLPSHGINSATDTSATSSQQQQQSEDCNSVRQPSAVEQTYTKQHSGEINHSGLTRESSISVSTTVSLLEKQMQCLRAELDHKAEELRQAEHRLCEQDKQASHAREEMAHALRLEKEMEVSRVESELTRLRHVCCLVHHQYQEVNRAFLALREETRAILTTLQLTMIDIQNQIHQSMVAINTRNEELVDKYLGEMKLRKKLHNQLVDLRGNIRVFCRVRPWIREDGVEEGDIVVTPDLIDDAVVRVSNKGRVQVFELDKVFGMDSTQLQVFDEVSALVRSVIDGYNVCIFAYGQTGSGKTHTMEGPNDDPGINQRALQLLFAETQDSEWQYKISASVMEIYNENLRDLLSSDPSDKLEIKMRPEGGLYVPGMVVVPVTSVAEVNQVFDCGRKSRVTASTNMNEHSSRSHCLLMVTVMGHNPVTGSSSYGHLNLVDLAGSERLSKSMADGPRLKEAQSINRSLSCLGDVIHARRNRQGHVPYRNSKLTYLLQDSLGGDSKTLMIVQVAPVEKNVSETMCTLTFGQRVRTVELGAASKHVGERKSTPTTASRPSTLNIPPLLIPSSPSSSSSSSPSTTPRHSLQTSPLSPSQPRSGVDGGRKSAGSSLMTPTSVELSASPMPPAVTAMPGTPKNAGTLASSASLPQMPNTQKRSQGSATPKSPLTPTTPRSSLTSGTPASPLELTTPRLPLKSRTPRSPSTPTTPKSPLTPTTPKSPLTPTTTKSLLTSTTPKSPLTPTTQKSPLTQATPKSPLTPRAAGLSLTQRSAPPVKMRKAATLPRMQEAKTIWK